MNVHSQWFDPHIRRQLKELKQRQSKRKKKKIKTKTRCDSFSLSFLPLQLKSQLHYHYYYCCYYYYCHFFVFVFVFFFCYYSVLSVEFFFSELRKGSIILRRSEVSGFSIFLFNTRTIHLPVSKVGSNLWIKIHQPIAYNAFGKENNHKIQNIFKKSSNNNPVNNRKYSEENDERKTYKTKILVH